MNVSALTLISPPDGALEGERDVAILGGEELGGRISEIFFARLLYLARTRNTASRVTLLKHDLRHFPNHVSIRKFLMSPKRAQLFKIRPQLFILHERDLSMTF